MTQFLQLPDSLIRTLLVEWLHVASIARIDNAYCNHAVRSSFCKIAFNETTAYKHVPASISSPNNSKICYFAQWVLRRGALISAIRIGVQLLHNPRIWHHLLLATGATLHSIEIIISEHFFYPIPDEMLQSICANCPNLTTFSMLNCVIPWYPRFECMLTKCDCIKNICISYGAHLPSGDKYKIIAKCCKQLQVLELYYTNIRNDDLKLLLQACTALTTLRLLNCGHIDAAELHTIPQHCHNLTELQINHPGLTDSVILHVAQQCTKLTTIALVSQAYTDISIQEVAKRCPRLQSIKLTLNANLTDATLFTIGEHCSDLVEIITDSCSDHLTSVGWAAVTIGCKKLKRAVRPV